MHQIDNAWTAATQPAPQPVGTPGWFQSGDETINLLATVVDYDWANTVQNEIVNVVHNAGLALSKTDDTQLLQSIIAIIQREATADLTAYVPLAGGVMMTGSLGMNVAVPADIWRAAPSFLTNGAVSLLADGGGLTFNSYLAGVELWHYLESGQGAGIINYSRTNGTFEWFSAIAGTAGNALQYLLADGVTQSPTPQVLMSLNVIGQLTIAASQAFKTVAGEWSTLTSDARVKQDVADYATGLEHICALRPVTFRYNGLGGSQNDGKTHIGLIAQEAQPVMPEIVIDAAAATQNPDGTPTPLTARLLPGQLGMDASALKFALVNAVQELAGRVAALERAA
jgi:Chaperone of endosialidase